MENQNKVRADLRQLKPFFIVAFVGIIYHLRIRPMAGDDVFFSQATSELGLWNYLIQRYETWTSPVCDRVSSCLDHKVSNFVETH